MEAKITAQTKKLLDKYIKEGHPLYYNKISDRFTSGIPDIQGTFYGISFYIELKAEGKKPRLLQDWHLRNAKKAMAETLATDDYVEVKKFLENIKDAHKAIVASWY